MIQATALTTLRITPIDDRPDDLPRDPCAGSGWGGSAG